MVLNRWRAARALALQGTGTRRPLGADRLNPQHNLLVEASVWSDRPTGSSLPLSSLGCRIQVELLPEARSAFQWASGGDKSGDC